MKALNERRIRWLWERCCALTRKYGTKHERVADWWTDVHYRIKGIIPVRESGRDTVRHVALEMEWNRVCTSEPHILIDIDRVRVFGAQRINRFDLDRVRREHTRWHTPLIGIVVPREGDAIGVTHYGPWPWEPLIERRSENLIQTSMQLWQQEREALLECARWRQEMGKPDQGELPFTGVTEPPLPPYLGPLPGYALTNAAWSNRRIIELAA